MKVMVKLWSLNRWLRFTGFRFVYNQGEDADGGLETRVGIIWWGWPNG